MQTTNLQASKKLNEAKEKLEKQVKIYRQQYRQLGITYKIADTAHQTEIWITNTITTITESVGANPVVKKIMSKLPGNREKQQVTMAKLLTERINRELHRSVSPEPEEFEVLLNGAEKIIRQT